MDMISKHFSVKEFRCPSSGILYVDPEFLATLESLRELMKEPMVVTSGCRGLEHNNKVGGSIKSYHITTPLSPCRAADISVPNGHYRFKLIELAIKVGFTGIGVYVSHIHLDNRQVAVVWRG